MTKVIQLATRADDSPSGRYLAARKMAALMNASADSRVTDLAVRVLARLLTKFMPNPAGSVARSQNPCPLCHK